MRRTRWCLRVGNEGPAWLLGIGMLLFIGGYFDACAIFLGAALAFYGCWLGYSEQSNIALLVKDDITQLHCCPVPATRPFNSLQMLAGLVLCGAFFALTRETAFLMAGAGVFAGGHIAEIFWELGRKPEELKLAA